jgi:hypothetical protein
MQGLNIIIMRTMSGGRNEAEKVNSFVIIFVSEIRERGKVERERVVLVYIVVSSPVLLCRLHSYIYI